VSGGDVSSFAISPDSHRVVYMADQDTDDIREFYSVPIAGPASAGTKLNGPMTAGGNGYYWFIVQFSADSSRVVYKVDQETPDEWNIYSVPIEGPASAGVKLNGPVYGGSAYCYFMISPDGRRVVYSAPQQADGIYELYSVPIEGPASGAVMLNRPLPSGSNVSPLWGGVQITPDSSTVVYRADQDQHDRWELYSVPIEGPASAGVKLNHDMERHFPPVGDDVRFFDISPDGNQVVFVATWVNSFDIPGFTYSVNMWELFRVPTAGPASAEEKIYGPTTEAGYPRRLVNAAPNSNPVNDVSIVPDGSRVVYRAEYIYTNRSQLYSIPIGGPRTANIRLDPTTPFDSEVEVDRYRISPDGSTVVYQADQDVEDVSELYSVPAVGPASTNVRLNGPLASGGKVHTDYRISPDGSRVVYRADQQGNGVDELYSVPLAGPSSQGIKINGALPAGGDVRSFRISANGRWIVYRADQDTDDVFELFASQEGAPQPTPTATPHVAHLYLPAVRRP